MEKLFKKLTVSLLFFVVFSITPQIIGAERYNLVLFYADWNVYSNQAIHVMEKVAEYSEEISFEKINIDDKKAFFRMKQLGVMPTNSIPYYFLLDKNKKVIYGSTYKNESSETIAEILKKRIN